LAALGWPAWVFYFLAVMGLVLIWGDLHDTMWAMYVLVWAVALGQLVYGLACVRRRRLEAGPEALRVTDSLGHQHTIPYDDIELVGYQPRHSSKRLYTLPGLLIRRKAAPPERVPATAYTGADFTALIEALKAKVPTRPA
jgi:hypothetical protein